MLILPLKNRAFISVIIIPCLWMLFGGIIGIMLGFGASYVASILIGYTFKFNPLIAMLALLFSLGVRSR